MRTPHLPSLVWWLRATLAALVLLVAGTCWCFGVVPGVGPRLPGAVVAADLVPGEVGGRAAFLVADGVACSGTLVGSDVVLTAGHCLFGPDGRPRESARVHFGSRGYDPTTGRARATLSCDGDRAWADSRRRHTVDAGDWGFLTLTGCRDAAGDPVSTAAAVLGHADLEPWRPGEDEPLLYLGYPTTPRGAYGVAQAAAVRLGYRPVALDWAGAEAAEAFTCSRGLLVDGGGSGGGVVGERDGRSVVRALNTFSVVDEHSCFRKVTDEMVRTVERVAAGQELPGAVTLSRSFSG